MFSAPRSETVCKFMKIIYPAVSNNPVTGSDHDQKKTTVILKICPVLVCASVRACECARACVCVSECVCGCACVSVEANSCVL